MTKELKACPFCGSEEISLLCPCDYKDGERSCIQCNSCKARGPSVITSTTATNRFHDIQPALEAWNTRVESPKQQAKESVWDVNPLVLTQN